MSFLDDLPADGAGSGSSNNASPLPISRDQHAVSSIVSNPEQQGSRRSKVTDFLVTTTFPNKSESLVRRTWGDFHWAYQRLVEERVGIIVPVLPECKPANNKQKFDEAFVELRQQLSQRWIQRIVGHPELVDAPSLLPFFTANPTDWKATKETAEEAKKRSLSESAEASNHSSNDFEGDPSNTLVISAEEAPQQQQKKKGMFGKWMSAKREQWALRNKNLVLEETPVESKRFEDMQAYADHLETCIRILAEDSQAFMQQQKIQSEKQKSIGAAFTQLWGEHELSNTSSSNMYQAVGDCWTNISKKSEVQSSFSENNLVPPLEELVLDVLALKEAIFRRKKVLYDYTKKVAEGRKMQQQMDKLRSSDLSQAGDQYFTLEREIRAIDAGVEESRKLKELITDRLTRDIERFRVEWHERMRSTLEAYHQHQVQSLQGQCQLWESVLPTLSKIESDRADLPTVAKKGDSPELTISYTTAGATVAFTSRDSEVDASPIAAPPAAAPPPPPA